MKADASAGPQRPPGEPRATAKKSARSASKRAPEKTVTTSMPVAGAAADDAGSGVDRRLVERLMAAIRHKIDSGEVPVGAWLRQERLAQDLGVSRMPIREALRQLQVLGVVEIVANRGARVRLPSAVDLIETYELRGVLESHAAAVAAERITSKQLERMRQAVGAFGSVIADLEADAAGAETAQWRWYDANTEFRSTLVEASGNHILAEVLESLNHKIPRTLTWIGIGVDDVRGLKRNRAAHEQILKAINDGDSDKARGLMLEYNKNASKVLLRALDSLAPGSSRPSST